MMDDGLWIMMRHMSNLIILFLSLKLEVLKLVIGGSVINGAYPVYF